jgi:hypothetical protein
MVGCPILSEAEFVGQQCIGLSQRQPSNKKWNWPDVVEHFHKIDSPGMPLTMDLTIDLFPLSLPLKKML